jgi:multisubunit Na+/H+ antiporter MnhG subunit
MLIDIKPVKNVVTFTVLILNLGIYFCKYETVRSVRVHQLILSVQLILFNGIITHVLVTPGTYM